MISGVICGYYNFRSNGTRNVAIYIYGTRSIFALMKVNMYSLYSGHTCPKAPQNSAQRQGAAFFVHVPSRNHNF